MKKPKGYMVVHALTIEAWMILDGRTVETDKNGQFPIFRTSQEALDSGLGEVAVMIQIICAGLKSSRGSMANKVQGKENNVSHSI
jgi:hypothetical protein